MHVNEAHRRGRNLLTVALLGTVFFDATSQNSLNIRQLLYQPPQPQKPFNSSLSPPSKSQWAASGRCSGGLSVRSIIVVVFS